MPNKAEQITLMQMGYLAYAAVMPTAILFLPAIAGTYTARDAWLAPILAGLFVLPIFFLFSISQKFFPRQSLIQAADKSLPWGLGRVVSLLVLIWLFQFTGAVLRQFSEFIVGGLITFTPISLVTLTVMVVVVYATYLGLETLARMAQVLVPLSFGAILLLTFLVLPQFNLDRLQPVLENGFSALIQASISPLSWYSEAALVLMFLPQITQKRRTATMLLAVLGSMVALLSWSSFVTIGIFGLLSKWFTFPFFAMSTYISVGDFLERLDAVIVAFWLAGLFLKINFFLYVTAVGLADWLDLPDYRVLVLPSALLVGVWSLSAYRNETELVEFLSGPSTIQLLFFVSIIFILLTLSGWIQKAVARSGKQ